MLVICKDCGKVLGNIEDCVVESFRNETNSEFLAKYQDMETGEVKEFHCLIYDGDFYCLDCMEENFVKCADCGDVLSKDEEYYTNLNLCTGELKIFCTTCYDEVWDKLAGNTNS